jgi:uncharacterized YigZ family protein
LKDSYHTIKNEAVGIFKDRGSKFIAYAFPVEIIQDFESKLEEIRKEHPKARHFCYAYQLDIDGGLYRHNDDGEPGGSAGLPIYNQIISNNLFKTAVVVVRYFGGKKLGVPGLINAYKSATLDALKQTEVIKKYIKHSFKISFQYDQTGSVMRVLNDATDLKIMENGYEEIPYIVFSIRRSQSENVKNRLIAILLKRDLDDIVGDEEVEGFRIEQIS